MSDDFIPLNQSTPVHNQKHWQNQSFHRSGQMGILNQNQNQRRQGGGGGYNQRRNFQRNSSYGSDNNHSQGKESIDAYLHPSMLQDPWEYLRKRNAGHPSN